MSVISSAVSKAKNIGHGVSDAFRVASGSKALADAGLNSDTLLPASRIGLALGIAEFGLAGSQMLPAAGGPLSIAFAATAAVIVALIPPRIQTGILMARHDRKNAQTPER
jgi:hypothetical protein